jgi:hypothetical protein
VRHVDVGHHHLGCRLADRDQALKAIGGRFHLHIGQGALHERGQDVPHAGIVVHDDGDGRSRRGCRAAGRVAGRQADALFLFSEQPLGAGSLDAAVPAECLPGLQPAGIDPALYRLQGHAQPSGDVQGGVGARILGHGMLTGF